MSNTPGVLIAMSGGVDSTVAADVYKRQAVMGAFIIYFNDKKK